ncbi:MAG: hypothetical protein WBD31_12655 [Rubripirellula sp.]
MAEIALKDERFFFIRACFEVYDEMVCGFLEAVYHSSAWSLNSVTESFRFSRRFSYAFGSNSPR